VLRRNPVGDVHRFGRVAGENGDAIRGERLPDHVATGRQPRHDGVDTQRERAAPGDENRPGIRVVFRLRDEIRGNPGGPTATGDDDDLRWSGEEVDGTRRRDKRFRDRDVTIAGPDDLVHAWNGRRAVRERRDGVRAADSDKA
jgi:hypothetical protein